MENFPCVNIPIQRRYTLRNRNTRKHFDDYSRSSVADLCLKVSDVVPVTYSQAVRSEDSQLWQKAMDSEMESLKDNHVFTVIPLPNGKKAVGGRWVYSLKNNLNGDVAHKARFVAKGYAQVKGSDYSDTFSPTAKMTTVRMLMQVSADHELVVHQLDVKTAYLNAPIDCGVYTIQPEGYKETKDGMNLVWKLNKSLYGLKQSGRNWNCVLSKFFQQNGFKQSEVDACLYFKHGESVIIFIVIWVDDIVIAASSEKLLNDTKYLLKNKFKMKDLGPISWILGIGFKQTDDGIEMGQSYYLKGILERFNMTDCKPRSTPCQIRHL